MKAYVGTSGWLYDWNLGKSLEWYEQNSGLNAIELNSSFYRFPFPNQIKGWVTKSKEIRWAVKVHRLITHLRKMNESSFPIWEKFKSIFNPLDYKIDFYLFQLSPNFQCKEEALRKLSRFREQTRLGERMAVEFRNETCYNEKILEWGKKEGITLVSVDSPEITWIVKSGKSVYLRLHGRESWYFYDYDESELRELIESALNLSPEKIYIFFNNDHWMLENARKAVSILKNYT
ncbi:MAG: DUF72 domain-containing protein [Fervidicoccaceae archaeon]